jgi:hypothetical protein
VAHAPSLIDVTPANFRAMPCCGIKNPSHPGRCTKQAWLESNFKLGVRAKTLVDAEGAPCGYIEYLPGEFAWRGVDAAGYMFIHCLWNHSKRHQRQGWGTAMIEACLEDARLAGRDGVAVVVREGPWLADRRLFLANGFEAIDTAPPDYSLLIRKINPSAANPSFKKDWDQKVSRYSRGLTIVRSSQCPYITKFVAEIVETAQQEYGIKPRIVDIRSWQDAQDAPTPYAVFALIYKGKLVADHQISRTRFRNIMNSVK